MQQLINAIFSGKKRHRTYRQFKMYNDPSLNPYLYRAACHLAARANSPSTELRFSYRPLSVTESEPIIRSNPGSPFPKFVVALALIPLALLLSSFLGRYFYIAEIICNFRCQIILMLLPFAFLLFAIRQWGWVIVVSIATAWSAVGIAWIYLPTSQPPIGPQKIKIMSFNVWTGNRSPQLAIQRIKEADADVVTILEYDTYWAEQLSDLDEIYPHQILEPRWHGYGTAIFSRYPLGDRQIYPLTAETTDVPLLVVSVGLGETKIRLAAVHLFSPTDPQRLALRNRQLQEIARLLDTSSLPTVVLGDFNCVPWSVYLEDFLRETGLRDSRQGFGFQASWHTSFPFFRIPIDHAFVSDAICIVDRYVANKGGSDHFPIVIEVSVTR